MQKKSQNAAKPAIMFQPEQGFTLVEILIAIVVLSVGFFAAASMQILTVDTNSSANRTTEAVSLAQSRLEELMTLEYSPDFTDPDLIDDASIGSAEPYIDSNGNGLWDYKEPYTDSNGNSVWDAAHEDKDPLPGYTITWSVTNDIPANGSKYVRVYVTGHDSRKTIILSCVKSME